MRLYAVDNDITKDLNHRSADFNKYLHELICRKVETDCPDFSLVHFR